MTALQQGAGALAPAVRIQPSCRIAPAEVRAATLGSGQTKAGLLLFKLRSRASLGELHGGEVWWG